MPCPAVTGKEKGHQTASAAEGRGETVRPSECLSVEEFPLAPCPVRGVGDSDTCLDFNHGKD